MNILLKPEIVKGLRRNKPIPLEIIAKKLGISVEEYKQLEEQEKELDSAEAQKLASMYGRNWTVFLLNEAPAKPNYDEDHRSTNNQKTGLGYKTYEAVEEADYLIDFIVDIAEDDDNKIPVFTTKLSPREMAKRFRKEINLQFKDQPEFENTADAIKFWVNRLAKIGINVATYQLGDDDGIRAFSLYRKTKAMIVLNTDETDNGKLFSMMHELAHILLRNTGVCDLNRSDIENFCNQFASELLIPDDVFTQLLEKYAVTSENAAETSPKLARRLRVSRLAILTRLLETKTISTKQYDALSREEYLKFNMLRKAKRDRQERRSESKKSLAINPYLVHSARIGGLFLAELFNAYHSGRITPFEAGKYLGFKPKTISKFNEWATHNEG
jgi:Zn-dependent peptidase ImmA (M78 family)